MATTGRSNVTMTFSSIPLFVKVYLEATTVDRALEKEVLEEKNLSNGDRVSCVLIKGPKREVLWSVDMWWSPTRKRAIAPEIGELCTLQLRTLGRLGKTYEAYRIDKPRYIKMDPAWDDHVWFVVNDGPYFIPLPMIDDEVCDLANSGTRDIWTPTIISKLEALSPSAGAKQLCRIQFRDSTTTSDTEKLAISNLYSLSTKFSVEGKVPPQIMAFRYLVLFKPKSTVNLFDDNHFPHGMNLALIRDVPIREAWEEQIRRFNQDQRAAYNGMSSVPDGVYIIPGCAGSGKTTWALIALGVFLCDPRKRRRALMLADIHSTLDGMAKKIAKLFSHMGLKKTVIRMSKLPLMLVNFKLDLEPIASAKTNASGGDSGSTEPASASKTASPDPMDTISNAIEAMAIANVNREKQEKESILQENNPDANKEDSGKTDSGTTNGSKPKEIPACVPMPHVIIADFLREIKIPRKVTVSPATEVLTLDQATAQFYEKKKETLQSLTACIRDMSQFRERRQALIKSDADMKLIDMGDDGIDSIHTGLVLNEKLKLWVQWLYTTTLKKADIIVTTPVAASCHNLSVGHVDIVLFDEAAHAREPSTMIPIASYKPEAWIYIGDYRQTTPYRTRPQGWDKQVEYAKTEQLEVSMMRRAAESGVIKHQLMVNYRARGGLVDLPSKLYYDGAMKSAYGPGEQFPPSVMALRNLLQGEVRKDTMDVFDGSAANRLIRVTDDSFQQTASGSSWNPENTEYAMKFLKKLLSVKTFHSINDPKEPPTIYIVTPYGAAANKYSTAIKKLVKDNPQYRGKIEARTANRVQGLEADFVILDLVRLSKFAADKNRLCVSLTRAMQGELILMGQLPSRKKDYLKTWAYKDTENLYRLYDTAGGKIKGE